VETKYTKFELNNLYAYAVRWNVNKLTVNSFKFRRFPNEPIFVVFFIYLIDNQLDFPISLCLTSCFIFHFYYLVYFMLRSFLKVETCVPIFTYFSTVTRYVTCSGPRLSNVPVGEQVVFTVVLFPSTSSRTTHTT
jgi:hypothetical protein